MKEIKEGEYIRTEYGVIYKYNEIEKNDIELQDFRLCNDGRIVKHSKNIIDLIEVGDYVNGEKVLCFKDKDNCDYDIGTEYSDDFGKYFGFNKEDIKNIATKEQFNSIAYRLEE